jgi:molybdopterin-guanine dinucleotide biosynthesis protein A
MLPVAFQPPAKQHITGCILAGGKGSRMGGVDKGLQLFRGQTLVQRAIHRLQAQVNSVMVNANRHAAQYALHGVPVFADTDHGFKGPLAGFLTGLQHCDTEWLVTVPCDSPFFPLDLVEKLAATAAQSQALIVMAQAEEPTPDGHQEWRLQPVFCLMHRQLASSLHAHIQSGGFKITEWAKQHSMAICPFTGAPGQLPPFANANTAEELQHLQSLA